VAATTCTTAVAATTTTTTVATVAPSSTSTTTIVQPTTTSTTTTTQAPTAAPTTIDADQLPPLANSSPLPLDSDSVVSVKSTRDSAIELSVGSSTTTFPEETFRLLGELPKDHVVRGGIVTDKGVERWSYASRYTNVVYIEVFYCFILFLQFRLVSSLFHIGVERWNEWCSVSKAG
jgi:hypothetical protein